jgi:AcrR family transcriptional regulator
MPQEPRTQQLKAEVAATKQAHILRAASAVFAQKGFHAATIRDVARAAGVADGTIYLHFANKGALLLGLFAQMADEVRSGIDPAALTGLDARGQLSAALAHPLRAMQAGQLELMRVVLSEALVNPELAVQFRAQVLAPLLQGAGPLPDGGGAAQALRSRLIIGLILGLVVQRALGDETLEAAWDDLPDALAGLLLGGLMPGPGGTP